MLNFQNPVGYLATLNQVSTWSLFELLEAILFFWRFCWWIYYIVLGVGWCFFVLLQPDKNIPFTGRPNVIGLSSQLSCLPPMDVYLLSCQTLKKNTVSCVCVCLCVINVQRVFTLRYLAEQKSYQCPVKMEAITRSLRTVIQPLSQQTGGSTTHQKNNVVIIYCCYLSQFS